MSVYSVTILKNEVSEDTTLFANITDTVVLNDVFGEDAISTTSVEISFDRNIQRQSNHRILLANFGDGYEQRVKSGINSKAETFSVTFNNRTRSEIIVLAAFLDNKVGGNFDILLNGETLKVTSEAYSTTYTQNEIHSLTTQLRRVYEP